MLKRVLTVAVFASSILSGTAYAQETSPAHTLLVDLNTMQPTQNGCRFTFVLTNNLGGELSSVGFELVLFDTAGMVSRMTIVDFKDLPDGKTKVRQFDFNGLDCAAIGRVLINDATECNGTDIEPSACIRALSTSSRTNAVFGI